MILSDAPEGTRLVCVRAAGSDLIRGETYSLHKIVGDYAYVRTAAGGICGGWMLERFNLALSSNGEDYQSPDDVDLKGENQ